MQNKFYFQDILSSLKGRIFGYKKYHINYYNKWKESRKYLLTTCKGQSRFC